MSWLVIADDLSGAADCAIGFAAFGANTVVTLAADTECRADVIAADVDSRRQDVAAAAARNVETWQRLAGSGRRLYKKIDSTLRGNWAAETAVLQRLAGLAIVAPAFPATGRTTREGCVYINGEALEQSDIWRLEGLAGRADVAVLLAAQGLRVARIGTGANASDIRTRLLALAEDKVQAVVCDAVAERDLEQLALAGVDLGIAHFWVGSGGLARALAAIDIPRSAAASAPSVTTPCSEDPAMNGGVFTACGPVLSLIGSLSGVSARQVAYLCERAPVERIEMPPQLLREGPSHEDWERWQARIGQHLCAGRDVLACIGRDAAFDPHEGPRLSTAAARLIAPHFHRIGGLIATGGETARAMLDAAGVTALALVREVEPGVPLSVTLAARAVGVVTKAGAFGSEAALWLAWQALKNAQLSDHALQRKPAIHDGLALQQD